MNPTLNRLIPYLSLAVATSALAFQISVLYPWHKRLENDFELFKTSQEEKIQEYHNIKMDRFKKIEEMQREMQQKLEYK